MTCIVAIETADGVWMGGDRLASDAYQGIELDEAKVFWNGPALIGCCGSIRQAQLMRYVLDVPGASLTWDVNRWVATDLTRAMIEMAEGWRASHVKDGVSRSHNSLLAVRGRIYELQADYSFTRCARHLYAVGSGQEYALGSLYSTAHLPPEERVRVALEAAAEFSPTVAGPFDVIRQEPA
jgi:ATP-dependent protease HslVU (ClpYQ) peptidase subunit